MKEETMIPVEKYAVMQRSSIYQVLKKIKNGELEAVVEEREGRKYTYVVMGEGTEPPPPAPEMEPQAPQDDMDWKQAYAALRKELDALRRDFDALKEKMETGRVVL